MASPFLKITPLSVGQTGKELTVNDGLARIEQATQRTLDVDFVGGDVSLTEDQFTTNFVFRCINLSADGILTIPDEIDSNGPNTAERVFAIENTSTDIFFVTVQTTGGVNIQVVVLPGEQVSVYSDGTDVRRLDNSFDLGTFFFDTPGVSQLMLRFTANRPFILPEDLIGSQCTFFVAATGNHKYIIRKNGAGSIGTVDLAAANTVATFDFGTETEWLPGDVISVEAPVVPDATAAGMALTLAGYKR